MDNATAVRYELMQDTYDGTDWETGQRIVRTEWVVWDTVLGTPTNWYWTRREAQTEVNNLNNA